MLVGNLLVASQFRDLEEREIKRNIDRTMEAVAREEMAVSDIAKAYAAWDEAYEFMDGHDPKFWDRNMKRGTLAGTNMDAMIYVDLHGQIVRSISAPRHPGLPPINDLEIARKLHLDRDWTLTIDNVRERTGIIQYRGKCIFAAAYPILRTDYRGEPHGWAIALRYLTDKTIENVMERAKVKVELQPVDISLAKHSSHDYQMLPLDGETMRVRFPIHDINGHHVAQLTLWEPREAYQLGQKLIYLVANLVFVSGLILTLLIFVIVDRLALRRVTGLTREVEAVNERASGGLSDFGNDEVGVLAQNIVSMLDRIRENRLELEVNHEELCEVNERLEVMVCHRTAELEAKTNILEHALTGISQLDKRGRLIGPNTAFAMMFGCHVEDLAGKPWKSLLSKESYAQARAAYRDAMLDGRAELEMTGLRKDGTEFQGQVVLVAAYDHRAQLCVHCFLRDVSDQKKLEAKIRHQAFHDALTGLPNRLLFLDRVQQGLRRLKRSKGGMGVMFIDLDNFKYVNDSLGHDEGDQLLKHVARRISEVLREEDTVARLGGDEFTVLLEGVTSACQVVALAERVVENLRRPIVTGGRELFMTTSVGVVFNEESSATPDELLRDADTAMYQAKGGGKNRVAIFSPEMNHRMVERLELESALRRAVEADSFRVVYQPIVDLKSQQVTGAEALIRWDDPVWGSIPPVKFIPIAEETGMIEPIGRFVLIEACYQARAWLDRLPTGAPFTMSVNVSVKQFQRAGFVQFVAETLRKTRLHAENLKLEITESVMLEDGDEIIDRLHELKALGVKLALDDFGTGYSSLSYLRRLPVDTVKIDRSFMSVLGIEEQPTAIVQAIVTLCTALSLNVTGEGIETLAQLAEIEKIGCQYAQGYHFSPPVSAEEFERLIVKPKAA